MILSESLWIINVSTFSKMMQNVCFSIYEWSLNQMLARHLLELNIELSAEECEEGWLAVLRKRILLPTLQPEIKWQKDHSVIRVCGLNCNPFSSEAVCKGGRLDHNKRITNLRVNSFHPSLKSPSYKQYPFWTHLRNRSPLLVSKPNVNIQKC
jgi:hypothetical protein